MFKFLEHREFLILYHPQLVRGVSDYAMSVLVYKNMYGHPITNNEQNATTFMCSH
jgi:hypothetical protein